MPSDVPSVVLDCELARHLFIGVPCYTGQPAYEMEMSVKQELYHLGAAGITVEPFYITGNCYIDQTRCQIVQKFLDSQATDLFFWDDDVATAKPGMVTRMAQLRRPVVGGIYPKKVEGEVQWPVAFLEQFPTKEPDGTVKAARLPTGFLRINRAVFENMDRVLQPLIYDDPNGKSVTQFFRCWVKRDDKNPRRGLYFGEDWLFCDEWRSIGGEVYVDPDIDFLHVGRKAWKGNWHTWSMAQMAEKHKQDYLAVVKAAE